MRTKFPTLLLLGTLSLGSLTLTGCSTPPPAPPPYPAMPAPLPDPPTKPPVTSDLLIWQPGHYDWTGSTYVWTRGVWVNRVGHGSLWQDGYWVRSGNDWVWVPPHWT